MFNRRLLLVPAVGLLLVAAIYLLAPLWLNSDAARSSIERHVSTLAGANIRYGALTLRAFPWSRVELQNVSIAGSDVIEGRITAVYLDFALLPLLRGEIKLSGATLVEPELKLHAAASNGGDLIAIYREKIGPLVSVLDTHAQGMSISVDRGKLQVVSPDATLISVSEFSGSLDVKRERVEIIFDSSANLWRKAKGRLNIAIGSLAGQGDADFTGLDLSTFLSGLATRDAWYMDHGSADGTLRFETDAVNRMTISSVLGAPSVALKHHDRSKELGAVHAAWQLSRNEKSISYTLQDLAVGEIVSGVSGVVAGNSDEGTARFNLKSRQLNLVALNNVVAEFADDRRTLPEPFRYLPAGNVSDLELNGTWPFAGLNAIRAQARLENATVDVPAGGLVVKNGNGAFTLIDGILEGRELTGDISRSSFKAGVVALELGNNVKLRHVGGELRADLGDALKITRHIAGAAQPALLAGIESIAGSASAKLDYDSRRKTSPLNIDFSNVRATARHREIPLPLRITRGDGRYSSQGLTVRGLAGGAGRSEIANADFDLALEPNAKVRLASGDLEVIADELMPWLQSIDSTKSLLAPVKSATGNAHIKVVRLAGALAKPATLDYEAVIEPRDVKIALSTMPAPLSLTGGKLAIDRRTVTLDRLAAAVGQSHAFISGKIDGYAESTPRANIELADGRLDQTGLDSIRERFQLPAAAMPRAPVDIKTAHLQWSDPEREPILAQGNIRVGDAVNVGFDFTRGTGELDVKRFTLDDQDTKLLGAIHWRSNTIDLSFDGALDRQTFARMFAQPPVAPVSLRGKLQASADLESPRRSSVNGKLEGEGLDLTRFGVPLLFERFKLEAGLRTVRILEAVIGVAGQTMNVSGSVEGGDKTWILDARLDAKRLDISRLLGDIAPAAANASARKFSTTPWDLPVTGRLAANADQFVWTRHELKQVTATVDLAPNRIVVAATQARYCGATAPFTAVLTPGHIDAKAIFQARAQPVAQTLQCLTPDAPDMTGTFDLDADLTSSGPPGGLRDNARGTFKLNVRDGRIDHSTVLERALDVDEVAARLEKPAKGPAGKAFDFTQVMLEGAVDGGRARLGKSVIDAPSLYLTITGDVTFADGALDLQGLLAPLGAPKRGVPILGNSLVVVPVRIRGTVDNPDATVMPAAAVASTLVNVITGRFLLPVNLLDSIRGGSREPDPKTESK